MFILLFTSVTLSVTVINKEGIKNEHISQELEKSQQCSTFEVIENSNGAELDGEISKRHRPANGEICKPEGVKIPQFMQAIDRLVALLLYPLLIVLINGG